MKHFQQGDQLWVFGSRADPSAKGGDIDLYIEMQTDNAKSVLEAQIAFLTDLAQYLEEQKIDTVIKFEGSDVPMHQHAKETGVRILFQPGRP